MNIKLLSTFLFALLIASPPVGAATVREQFKASVAELQKSPDDKALREKIIKLALKLKPKPATPTEVRRRMARGRAAVRVAEGEKDFAEAVEEFEKAALIAPWLAQIYYNLGVVQEKAGDYSEAIESLKLYLLAAPGAQNAAAVEEKIFEIEFIKEKTEKKAKRLADIRKAHAPLKGVWIANQCAITMHGTEGCNKEERRGTNWRYRDSNRFEFKFLEDGAVTGIPPEYESWARCKGTVFGIPNGPYFGDIRWEVRSKDGETKRIYSKHYHYTEIIELSCDRPLSDGDFDPNKRYHYLNPRRP